jgi:hypothetical protein
MQTSNNQGAIVPSASITPVYAKAIALTAAHYKVMVAFVSAQMQQGIDYETIPGTNKPTLLKPGAEKLCRLFNLRPNFNLIQSVVNFEKPIFHYHYRCSLYRSGEMVGEGDGCANSMENKYQKQKYKIYDLTNTICKIAQKRALVARAVRCGSLPVEGTARAVLSSCGASEFFSQDLDVLKGGES